jgi:hypothetical protein
MDSNQIIQAIITIISSGFIITILTNQIKSQQEQILAMKGNMDSMKSYMDMFKIDEVKKYITLKEEKAVIEGTNTAHKIIKDTIQSEEWMKVFMEPFQDKFMQLVQVGHFDLSQELFDNTIEHLCSLPEKEMQRIVLEMYPLNSKTILAEFDRIEKDNPDFLKERRESFLKTLPQNLMSDEEKNQIQI